MIVLYLILSEFNQESCMSLDPKVKPSTSVGFQLGVFTSGAEVVISCAYSNFGT